LAAATVLGSLPLLLLVLLFQGRIVAGLTQGAMKG
jgi:multiple sugar transport system permease protein